MKQFSLREFLFLCLPVLLVAVVGFLLSRPKPPPPGNNKLHLEFHLEKPTVLEAFDGNDVALVVELKGPNTDYKTSRNPWYISDVNPFLELKTGQKTQKSFWYSSSGFWNNVWKNSVNDSRFGVQSRHIPAGKLRFGIDAPLALSSSGTSKYSPHIQGIWNIDRTQIKPVEFAKMPRSPLVHLSSVKIIEVKANSKVRGEAVFDLVGAAVNKDTPFDYSFHDIGGSSGMSSGSGASDLTPQTATRRVREWTVRKDSRATKQMVHVSGRVTANERWPLAFQFETFEYTKARVGQILKFKSWPAPTPSP